MGLIAALIGHSLSFDPFGIQLVFDLGTVLNLSSVTFSMLIPREAAHRFRDDVARLFRNILAH